MGAQLLLFRNRDGSPFITKDGDRFDYATNRPARQPVLVVFTSEANAKLTVQLLNRIKQWTIDVDKCEFEQVTKEVVQREAQNGATTFLLDPSVPIHEQEKPIEELMSLIAGQ